MSDNATVTCPDQGIVSPLYLVPRVSTIGVRDATHQCVAMLRIERCENGQAVAEMLARSVNHNRASEYHKAELAGMIGREVCWDAIVETVGDLLDERNQMQKTIGELRGRLSMLNAN